MSCPTLKNGNGGPNGAGGRGSTGDEDPDPAQQFPEWAKMLLLLLDYAMIEGLRRRLDIFAHLLDMARLELHAKVGRAAEGGRLEQTDSGRHGGDDPADS